jgi:hypothetical protein
MKIILRGLDVLDNLSFSTGAMFHVFGESFVTRVKMLKKEHALKDNMATFIYDTVGINKLGNVRIT